MKSNIFFKKIAATVAVTGMMLLSVGDLAGAAEILRDGDTVDGFIRSSSPTFRFRNESRTGSPSQTASGEEYTFNAERGDVVNISVDVDRNSDLAPVLVLISSDTGRQVAYEDTSNSLRYRVPVSGEYRLLVLGQNNSRGNYTLSISGITEGTAQNPSGSRNDFRQQRLQDEFGLRVLDSCPPATGSLVVVNYPEGNQTYRYCANPNRVFRAGEYTYDSVSGELRPGTSTATNSSSDRRRQLLEDEFGLQVFDSCPPSIDSLVVISFPENTQTYRYCANPTRQYPAGDYVYNSRTDSLDASRTGRRTERCAVEVGGICVVR